MVGSAKCCAFAIRPDSIEIKNTENTNISQQQFNQCSVTCRSCGQSISFIDTERCGYAVFNKITKHARRQSDPLQKCDVKQNLAKYIKKEDNFYEDVEPMFMTGSAPADAIPQVDVNDEDEIDFIDEGDFEYMFSGKTDPFIGSFKDHFIASPIKPLLA